MIVMGVPAMECWFSSSIRRNRSSFIAASMMLNVVMLSVFVVLYFFNTRNNFTYLVIIIFSALYMLCGYFLVAQRFRDMGGTGWLCLLWIPVVVADKYVGGAASLAFYIILCVVPGTRGANRYGDDPLK